MTRIRHAVEATLTALLFSLQHIPVIGFFMGLMCFPLWTYFLSFYSLYFCYGSLRDLINEINYLFFSMEPMFGRIIATVGFIIFLSAFIQYLRRREGLMLTGLYSLVRHPQYLGIIVMTLGITIMCLQYNNMPEPIGSWVVQVFGYILLARYEERHLIKEYGARYQGYKQRIPFIFPILLARAKGEKFYILFKNTKT